MGPGIDNPSTGLTVRLSRALVHAVQVQISRLFCFSPASFSCLASSSAFCHARAAPLRVSLFFLCLSLSSCRTRGPVRQALVFFCVRMYTSSVCTPFLQLPASLRGLESSLGTLRENLELFLPPASVLSVIHPLGGPSELSNTLPNALVSYLVNTINDPPVSTGSNPHSRS